MIYKIQRSIETTTPTPQVLVYDEARKHVGQLELTPKIERLFGNEFKLFVHCTRDKKGAVHIDSIAPWQDW